MGELGLNQDSLPAGGDALHIVMDGVPEGAPWGSCLHRRQRDARMGRKVLGWDISFLIPWTSMYSLQ